jgi:hypothetical protein
VQKVDTTKQAEQLYNYIIEMLDGVIQKDSEARVTQLKEELQTNESVIKTYLKTTIFEGEK